MSYRQPFPIGSFIFLACFLGSVAIFGARACSDDAARTEAESPAAISGMAITARKWTARMGINPTVIACYKPKEAEGAYWYPCPAKIPNAGVKTFWCTRAGQCRTAEPVRVETDVIPVFVPMGGRLWRENH